MQMRIRVAAALLILTTISQSATAQGLGALDQAEQGLELSSRLLAGGEQVELQISGGPASGQVWLLSVDEPHELVAVRARLEGNWAANPPTGEHDLEAVRLDGEGTRTLVAPKASLREWIQVVQPTAADGFRFSDLTRGARTQMGSFSGANQLQNGFVLVTEFMKDPAQVSDTQGEWFELFNAGPHRADVEGWVISDDGSNAHLIFNGGSGLWMLPRRRLVLGRNADVQVNGGVMLDYAYTGFTLSNSSDQIVLSTGTGRLVDRVAYDDGVVWPDTAGMSISLQPGAEDPYANDDGANWCHSTRLVTLNSSDTGTPGDQNDVCP